MWGSEFQESPGALRASQIVSMSGPGAIVQVEHDSVLVMGIDTWNKKYCEKLHHPYLEQLLGKDHFKMPRQVDRHRVISCRSFPLWGVCSNPGCGRLQRHGTAPPSGRRHFSCRDCRSEIYAAKFVTVCKNGHLGEFPWAEWAHSKSAKGHMCQKNPRLRFMALGKSPGLSDYRVKCVDCRAVRSCAGATSENGLKDIIFRCGGDMPWLGRDEECNDGSGSPMRVRGIQIRSTGMYYPVTVTALHVPEWLHPIQKCIGKNADKIKSQLELKIVTPRVIAEQAPSLQELREEYTVDDIEEHIKKRFAVRKGLSKDSTDAQVRKREYDDLMLNEFMDDDGYLEIASAKVHEDIAGHVERLKQIKRLTEIRVMRAFTREEPTDPYLPESQSARYCPISGKETDWYPAVENRGEGFLLALDGERLRRWESKPAVQSRCNSILGAFDDLFPRGDYEDPRRAARYVLLHTLSHVLVRGVAEVSGYSEASIRERIYSGDGHNGILLYTATPSSDGSLGGLVRQGETGNFARLARSSVRRSMRCTRDPLCAESNPSDMARAGVPRYARVNASACYGCVLLPETSCENVNRLLDRRLLFDREFGYFAEWVTA